VVISLWDNGIAQWVEHERNSGVAQMIDHNGMAGWLSG